MRELKGVPRSAVGLERTANEGSFVRCAVHKRADAQLLEQASDGGPRFHWHVSVSAEDETFPEDFFLFLLVDVSLRRKASLADDLRDGKTSNRLALPDP